LVLGYCSECGIGSHAESIILLHDQAVGYIVQPTATHGLTSHNTSIVVFPRTKFKLT
jgi:hypothetical protein